MMDRSSDYSDFVLLEDEVLQVVHDAPALVKYVPGDSSKPLVVCIPGGAHTARIFYGGHPGYRQEDFLAYWVQNGSTDQPSGLGNSVLALSYPSETLRGQTMLPATPEYTVQSWGRQTATITAECIKKHGLSEKVILVLWSMGGRIIEPFCTHAAGLGLSVTVAISLSATPGIFGLRPKVSAVPKSSRGYARRDDTLEHFRRQLETENILNSKQPEGPEYKEIIDVDSLATYYLTNTPVNLTGWGFRYRETGARLEFEQGSSDDWADINDANVHHWEVLPLVAVIRPTLAQDFAHAIGDRASWGLINSYRLISKVGGQLSSRGELNPSLFEEFQHLADSVPDKLSRLVQGNHYFFVGREGARRTARFITELHEAATSLHGQFESLLS